MRRVDDGKECVFNRGDPAGGSISHSNNELQEVSRGHSSKDIRGNPERAKARTVNCWSKIRIVAGNKQHQPRGVETPYASPSTKRTEKQHMSQRNLMAAILAKDNLNTAYKQVVRNKGAAGVDGMTCAELLEHLKKHGEEIKDEVKYRLYKPLPVRRVEIPKPDGSMRKLGVPTVTDRFLQQAVTQVLSPIFEKKFHDCSYGFRPGRSAQQAVLKATEYLNEGYNWVVDLDLEKFFDNVDHDILIALLSRTIQDGSVISLIRKFLVSGVMIGEETEPTELGTVQGGNISPLLANVMLNEFDWELNRRGLKFVRYADDCMILVKSRKAAERVLKSVTNFLSRRLHLKVNITKSKIARPQEVKFLGFGFYCVFKEKKFRPRVHPKSAEKLYEHVRKLTKRSWGVGNDYKVHKLNEVIRGWANYFKIGAMLTVARKADRMIRYRMRMCIWKHWKNPKTRYRRLVQLGVNEGNARMAAGNLAYARICRSEPICFAISNDRLEKFGLISMEKYFQKQTCIVN